MKGILIVAVSLWASTVGIGGGPTVLTVTGERLEVARIDGLGDAGFLVRDRDGGPREIPLASVVSIRYRSSDTRVPADAAEVVLSDGDRLVGRIEGGSETSLRIRTSLGAVDAPVEAIRYVLFPAHRAVPTDEIDLSLRNDRDTLYRIAGRSADRTVDTVGGTLVGFGKEDLAFTGPGGSFTFRYEDLAALVLAATGPPREAPPSVARVRGGDGTAVTGILATLTPDEATLRDTPVGLLQIPAGAIDSISFRNPAFVFLSDLEPVEVRETPYFGPDDAFLFRFRRDRTVSGGELVLGGIRYEKGLGVHARCVLAYDLAGRFRTFHSLIGIDDEAERMPATAVVAFRVVVDGDSRFESGPFREGDPPRIVPGIDVSGAHRLVLEVDFGDASDAGDRAIWANALLTRAADR